MYFMRSTRTFNRRPSRADRPPFVPLARTEPKPRVRHTRSRAVVARAMSPRDVAFDDRRDVPDASASRPTRGVRDEASTKDFTEQRSSNTVSRKTRSTTHRDAVERAERAMELVIRRVRELERMSVRNVRAKGGSGRVATSASGAESASGRKEGKNASRLRIGDDGEFPTLGVNARRNLTSALEGTEGPRRLAPTAVAEPSSGARRIAPTVVSRPMSGREASGTSTGFVGSAFGAPLARTRSKNVGSTSPTSSARKELERLYVAESSAEDVDPIELDPTLANLANSHAEALRAGYPLDQSSALARLFQLLSAPSELEVETETNGDARGPVLRTGREAHAYACAILSLVPSLALALGERALEALAESRVLASHAPALHAKIVREFRSIRVASGETERAYQLDGWSGGTLHGFDLLDALAKASERSSGGRTGARGRVIPLAERQAIEHNRERTRDAFYALLRASASRTGGLGQDAAIGSKSRALVASTHPANMRWLADLFVARLSQSSAVGEVDEELGKSIKPERLSRLHERIVGPSSAASQQGERGSNVPPRVDGRGPGRGRGGRGGRGGNVQGVPHTSHGFGDLSAWPSFACMFPPAQQPFVRFIETTDSHKFCVALKRSLIEALHAIDPNSSPRSDQTTNSSGVGQTERMLAAQAIGSFLGMLTFGIASSSTGTTLEGIDLVETLHRATRRGELVLSAPWVLAFLRFLMWDVDSLEIQQYAAALTELRAIAASPSLDPSVTNTDFNVSRMCLRAILANGLSVSAPITTAQAASWVANNVMALPPPPLAAMESLPTTSKEDVQSCGDPLRTQIWGMEWVPSASANASATANTQEVPGSPSDADARSETNVAPDLSRMGVDGRYVETVCPIIEQAVRTMKQRLAIAHALAEESEQVEHAETNLMETPSAPSAPVNAPRRVLAQPQRLEPTSVTKAAQLRIFGSETVLDQKNTVSPTFGVASPVAESTLASMPSMEMKSSATEIKHALQRAFLQNVPGLRRLVDFAVDAATLAAVDDATAAVTAKAVSSAQMAVSSAAMQAATKYADTAKRNGTTFVSHAGAVIEEAWTPEFERAVERSAMAATREVISSVERAASEDAGARAAAAVAALAGASTGTESDRSTASTSAACGVAADAAAFAAAARVRSNLPFELHARIATDARRLLKSALHDAKEAMDAQECDAPVNGTKQSAREAEYASIAASAIASALSSASKWPAGTLLAECASLKSLAERKVDALTLARGIENVVESVKKVLEQDAKFSRVQLSRKKPSAHVDKHVPDSRPGEKLAALLSRFARSFVKILLAAPQNALWKTTKAKSAEEGWGISRDEVCEGVTSTFVATFIAAEPALSLVEALAPPDAPGPWKRVYDEIFAAELWLPALREFPASPFAQHRIELVFADALAKLPKRAALRESFLRLIDEAGKRVGILGHALALRSAIRFCAVVAETSTHENVADSSALRSFASDLIDRCRDAREPRLARRAETAQKALTRGLIGANMKSIADPIE